MHHLPPDQVHTLLSALENADLLTITLEREVEAGRTEIYRGGIDGLDEDTVTIDIEGTDFSEDVPLTEIVRIAIER